MPPRLPRPNTRRPGCHIGPRVQLSVMGNHTHADAEKPSTLQRGLSLIWPACEKFWRLSQREDEIFKNVIEFANTLERTGQQPLFELIKLLLRPLQSSRIASVVERPAHAAGNGIRSWTFFMGEKHSYLFLDNFARIEGNEEFKVRLTSDVILPSPWSRCAMASALANVGTGKPHGPWRQDSNHYLELWLPWRIAFVIGGNHSIAAGIIAGEGELIPRYAYDMSRVLDIVSCDGAYYRFRQTGKAIAKVANQRIAAVFEIGRLIRSFGKASNEQ